MLIGTSFYSYASAFSRGDPPMKSSAMAVFSQPFKKKLFTLFHCRFSVDVPGPDDLEAKGDFFDHEYEFTLRGQPVAQVSKKWISWTDSYAIRTEPGQNDTLLLAFVVVID